jgi:hypothetical protein
VWLCWALGAAFAFERSRIHLTARASGVQSAPDAMPLSADATRRSRVSITGPQAVCGAACGTSRTAAACVVMPAVLSDCPARHDCLAASTDRGALR